MCVYIYIFYSLRDTRRPTCCLMGSSTCAASRYHFCTILILRQAFLAPFGLQGSSVWRHLGPQATPFGTLGTHLWTWSESSKIKRPKKSELLLFGDPFLDTFSPKSWSNDQ